MTMKKIKNALSVLISDLFVIIRIITGCKIKASLVSLISPFASIRTFGSGDIRVGYKVSVRPNVEITAREGKIKIGSNCFINRNCMVVSHKEILIEDNVTIGPGTVIYDHDHDGNGGFNTSPIHISKNVWIGANTTILKGVTIGENATIAAGSVISKNVPANVIVIQKKNTEYRKKVDNE